MSKELRTGTPPPETTILVTGDVVRDIYVYKGDREFPAQPGSIQPHFTAEEGGAKNLWQVIKATWSGKVNWGLGNVVRGIPEVQTLWTACDGGTKKDHKDAAKDDKPKQVWKVSNSLGYSLGSRFSVPTCSPQAKTRHDVIVLDDAGLSFRAQTASKAWPAGIAAADKEKQPAWIIHKMGAPVCQGDLWRALIAGATQDSPRRNLVVIVSADEMRRGGAALSRGISWERTLSDLFRELDDNPNFQPLMRFPRHLIVNFGCNGAIWFGPCGCEEKQSSKAADRATLVYDPTLPEGGFKSLLASEQPVYGHLNTFTAVIADSLAALEDATTPPTPANLADYFAAALGRGLSACRTLRVMGHGEVENKKPGLPLSDLANDIAPTSPKGRLITTLSDPFHLLDSICGAITPENKDTWNLAAFAENPPSQHNLPLYGLAHRVALYGYSALKGIPHAHFGVMVSVDRREMETLRGISQLIRKYQNAPKSKEPKPEPPLSIAAFGPPGAGKSFGIKEITKEILGEKVPILEFNLSQFDSSSGLHGAFHQVRDQALKGVTPVVFWDEFDSHNFKWLQYLLAPMQDGVFEENGHTHTIGKCIFVFAGATSWDFAHFGPAPLPAEDDKTAREALAVRFEAAQSLKQAEDAARDEFRRKKGPDFLSRLDAHIDVLGPNQRLLYDWKTRTWITPDPNDITFPVRRALLLRQFLGAKKGKDHLKICRDLLRAFLHVPRYTFSARSLEKVAKPAAANPPPFRRAQLPPPQVLQQHLETAEEFDQEFEYNRRFLSLINLNKIAAAIDENYSRHVDATQAAKAEKEGRPHSARPPLSASEFQRLFEAKQSSAVAWDQWLAATNLAAAQRLPNILALVGLRLVEDAANPKTPPEVTPHLEKHLTTLAKEEHDLWMEFHLANGWRQADDKLLKRLAELKITDPNAHAAEIKRLKKEERIHTMLIPFDELGDEQSKDHDAIRNYPETVALVGWKIEFVRTQETPA